VEQMRRRFLMQNQLSNCNLSAYKLPTNLTEERQIKWIVAVNCEATNYQGAGFSVLHHDHLDLKIEIQIRSFHLMETKHR
jgi:hypothetical protein